MVKDGRVGTPEYAYLGGHQDFVGRLASEPASLKASVGAIQFHTFKHSLTEIVGQKPTKLVAVRACFPSVPLPWPVLLTRLNITDGAVWPSSWTPSDQR